MSVPGGIIHFAVAGNVAIFAPCRVVLPTCWCVWQVVSRKYGVGSICVWPIFTAFLRFGRPDSCARYVYFIRLPLRARHGDVVGYPHHVSGVTIPQPTISIPDHRFAIRQTHFVSSANSPKKISLILVSRQSPSPAAPLLNAKPSQKSKPYLVSKPIPKSVYFIEKDKYSV